MRHAIETVSLFILIAVVILRPLVSESYDSAISPMTAALDAVSDPSPLRTLVFDGLILLSTGGWLVAWALGPPRPFRPTGLGWGAAVAALAAIASCVAAGNKRLAINASIDWLCYPILAITLAQLLSRPWHRRLLISAVLATACVQAGRCFEEHFVQFDDTWADYQLRKEALWADQGVDLDSPKVQAFERRILSREASGFLTHSNIAGSYLVLCGMAAIGLSITRWRAMKTGRDRVGAVVAIAGAMLIVSAVVLTKSLGAMIAAGVAVVFWGVVVVGRRWIDRRRGVTFVLGWACVAAAAVAVTAYGLHRDRLPSWSLTFRWQYWRASSELIADHWLTGVGRENFGRCYLRYKSIESPEEVANPHNLLVQAAADWGVPGLFGVVLMLVGGSWVLVRRPSAGALDPRAGPEHRPSVPARILWLAALTLVVTLGRLPLLGTTDPYFLYYDGVTVGLTWLIGFLVFGGWWLRPDAGGKSDARYLTDGVAFGLFAFLLHDMINFAAFVPGSATTLFALLGFCVAERASDELSTKPPHRPRWRLALGTLTASLVIMAYVAVVPVARCAWYLGRARQTAREIAPAPIAVQLAQRRFEQAIGADPLDPTPCGEHARWLVAAAVSRPDLRAEAPRLALDSLAEAVRRDPFNTSWRRMQMEVYRIRAGATGDAADYLAAADAAERVVELYPSGPSGYVALADRQREAAEAAGSRELLDRAIENYKYALTLDDQRLWWEDLRRFTEKEKDAIRSKLERARALRQDQSP